MSEKKMGDIGTNYVNRKTGKEGKLVMNDEDKKVLVFNDDAGDTFTVSYSAFHSNWRKLRQEEPGEAPELSNTDNNIIDNEEKQSVPDVLNDDPEKLTEEEMVNYFNTKTYNRKIDIVSDESGTNIFVDGFKTITLKQDNESWSMRMLPDIYTYTNWPNTVFDFGVCSIKEGPMTIKVSINSTLPEILYVIADTIADLNLYGYTFNDTNEKGENDGTI